MPRIVTLVLAGTLACQPQATAQQKPVEQSIAEAVSPLPEPLRDGATVRALRGPNRLETLRDGAGVMICLTDDPNREGWHVACYHRDLEPFMARGRELRAAGADRSVVDSVRAAEIEAGTLEMPGEPRALYSLTGPEGSFDPKKRDVTDPEVRGLYVLYMPYATERTTGISTEPSRERPWLMFPGTPWAHVMISRNP